ncbi:MAG: NUDIX hydrolase [Candidatus Sericytochromatia bacterium]|nr:NUDIX hydrolase [Candidatus Sericytochromatia bacterium]
MAHDAFPHLTERGLTREVAWQGRLLQVWVHEVALPDGRIARREVLEHPGAVAIAAHENGSVVLVRQYRHAIGRVTLELPAGTCTPGEPHDETARRELAEETGLAAASWMGLGDVHVAPGWATETVRLYEATGLSPIDGHEPDDDEFVEQVRLPLSEALAMAKDGRLRDAKTVVGLLRLGARLGL